MPPHCRRLIWQGLNSFIEVPKAGATVYCGHISSLFVCLFVFFCFFFFFFFWYIILAVTDFVWLFEIWWALKPLGFWCPGHPAPTAHWFALRLIPTRTSQWAWPLLLFTSGQKCENQEIAVMPGLHLPRTPYDLLVYDFPYDFRAS